jgi:precorrin-6A/cobalt-precorrin-6A reductase
VPAKRILVLGGTAEARILAGLLLHHGYEPISSLAGVTANPHQPPGQVRKGGFGGAGGLADYCKHNMIAAIVDATHPFAAQISRHAFEAAQTLSMPIARLERPGWREQPGDRWLRVANIAAAVDAVPEDARVLLTIGRKEAHAFFGRPGISGIARMIEPPVEAVPPSWTVRLARPPFLLRDECELMKSESIDCLVCKDAGGDETRAKLDAARECGIPVVMISRPIKPSVPEAHTPEAVMALTETLLRT